jgi:hypothetical protein
MSAPNPFLQAAAAQYPDGFLEDLKKAWHDIAMSNGEDSEAERQLYWADWATFTKELQIDPTLANVDWREQNDQTRSFSQLFLVFAQKYRQGNFTRRNNNGSLKQVPSEAAEKALRAIGEMFALYTSFGDPLKRQQDGAGKLDLMFEGMLVTYKKQDPLPEQRQNDTRARTNNNHTSAVSPVAEGPRQCGCCNKVTSGWSANDPTCEECRENFGCTACRKDEGSFCSSCNTFWCFGCPGQGVTVCDECYALFCSDCGDFKPGPGQDGDGGRLCTGCQAEELNHVPLDQICRSCGSLATNTNTRTCELCRGTHCEDCAFNTCEECNLFCCQQCETYVEFIMCVECSSGDKIQCTGCCEEHNQADQPGQQSYPQESIPRFLRY